MSPRPASGVRRVRLVSGPLRALWLLQVALRVLAGAVRRWGPIGGPRELVRYLRDHGNLAAGAGRHLVARGTDIYAASALPSLRSAAFVAYVLDEVDAWNHGRLAPLLWVLVSVSSRCPYRCEYCYALDSISRSEETVPLPALERVVADARAMGIPAVFLTGGEPLMRREDLPRLLEAGSGLAFWLVTTGWGVDVALLRRLAALGLVGVVVSLDSEDESEAVRAKGHGDAFRNSVAAIAAAQQAGLLVGVDTMVPAGSPLLAEAGFARFADFLAERGVHFLNLFPPHPIGAALRHGLRPLTGDDVLALERLCAASNRRPGRPLAYAAVAWERRRGCAGGQQFVYVDPGGDVRPCPFLDWSAGNVRQEDLRAIVGRIRARGEQDGCFHAIVGLPGRRRMGSGAGWSTDTRRQATDPSRPRDRPRHRAPSS